MLSPEWLATLDEKALTSTYEDCRFIAKTYKRHGDYGLATWWNAAATQCCNAIGDLYKTPEPPAEQMTFAGVAPRVAPDLRS